MATSIGWASLSVIPTISGVGRDVQRQISGPLKSAGKKAGKDAGQAVAEGLKSAERAVSAASGKLAAARKKEADAAGKVRTAEAKLQALRDKGVTDVGRLTAAEEAAEKSKRDHQQASGSLTAAEKRLSDAQDRVKKATDEAADSTGKAKSKADKLTSAVGNLGGKMQSLPGPLGAVGGALMGVSTHFGEMGEKSGKALLAKENLNILATGALTAGATITGALYKVGSTFDDVTASLTVATGATGDQLAGLSDMATAIGTEIPTSFDKAAGALGALSNSTGATGDDLKDLTENVLNASRLMGEDGASNAKAYGKALQKWGVDAADGADSMDALFDAARKSNTPISTLMQQLTQNTDGLQAMGFSMDETVGLLGKFAGSGVQVSRVMSGLNSSLKTWSQDGMDANEMLHSQVDAIRDAQDPTEALAIATDTFGKSAGVRLVNAIQNGTFSLDDLSGSLEESKGSISDTDDATRTFSESWQILKNKGLAAIKGPAEKVFGLFTDWFKTVSNFLGDNEALAEVLKDIGMVLVPMGGALLAVAAGVKAWAIAQAILNSALLANPLTWIAVAIAGVVAAVVIAWNKFEGFRNVVMAVWDGIKTAFSAAWDFIKPIFSAIKDWVVDTLAPAFMSFWHNVIEPAFNAIGDVISWVWENVIKPAWGALKFELDAIGKLFSWVWENVIQPVWDALGDGISWVWENVIKPAWDAMHQGLDLLKDAFNSAVGFIGDVWDKIRHAVAQPVLFVVETVYENGIKAAWDKVAGWLHLPELGSASDIIDSLKGFATGGIYPGYTPGRDIGMAAVSGGEAIMRPEWTRAVGAGYVDEANAAARAGGVGGVRRFLGGFADGGIVAGLTDWVQHFFPQMQMTSGYRPGDPGYHGMGLAADFSNAYNQNSPEMDKLASMINHAAGKDSLELIHGGGFGHNVKDGRDVGDGLAFYGADTMAQHVNHVHWAMDHVPDLPDDDEGWFSKALGAAKHAAGAVVSFLRDRVADAFDAIVNPIGNMVHSTFSGDGIEGFPGAAFDMIRDKVRSFLVGKADDADGRGGPGDVDWVIGEGVRQWIPQIKTALEAEGFPTSDAYVNAALAQMTTESGGNPNIIQTVHDVNWPNNKARGLMQVTPDTAAGLGLAELGGDIYDPVTNIRLGLRRIKSGWGGDLLGTWGHGHGYDSGGWLQPGVTRAVNATGLPEPVLTAEQWAMIRDLIETVSVDMDYRKTMLEKAGKAGDALQDAAISGATSWADDALGTVGLSTSSLDRWTKVGDEFDAAMEAMREGQASALDNRKAVVQSAIQDGEDIPAPGLWDDIESFIGGASNAGIFDSAPWKQITTAAHGAADDEGRVDLRGGPAVVNNNYVTLLDTDEWIRDQERKNERQLMRAGV